MQFFNHWINAPGCLRFGQGAVAFVFFIEAVKLLSAQIPYFVSLKKFISCLTSIPEILGLAPSKLKIVQKTETLFARFFFIEKQNLIFKMSCRRQEVYF